MDFADLCIVSQIDVTGAPAPGGAFRLDEAPGVAVVPRGAPGDKCRRCWKILPEVGRQRDPNLCGRCQEVVHS